MPAVTASGPTAGSRPGPVSTGQTATLDAEGARVARARQASKIGAQGTFAASNVLGLQAGGATDRMAKGIDKIERNTRPLRNAEELSFT